MYATGSGGLSREATLKARKTSASPWSRIHLPMIAAAGWRLSWVLPISHAKQLPNSRSFSDASASSEGGVLLPCCGCGCVTVTVGSDCGVSTVTVAVTVSVNGGSDCFAFRLALSLFMCSTRDA